MPITRPKRSVTRPGVFRQLGLGYANLGAMLMALGACPTTLTRAGLCAASITALMTGHGICNFGAYSSPDGAVRRVITRTRSRCSKCSGCIVREVAKIDEEKVPPELLVRPRRPGTTQSSSPSPMACATPRPRAGTDRDNIVPYGLRHHRDRARPWPRQDKETGRRRDDVDREPDRAPRPQTTRLHARMRSRDRRRTSTSTSR